MTDMGRLAVLALGLGVPLLALSVDDAVGATYYVCDNAVGADADCVPGDDANSGTNSATPWRSFTKAISTFNSMNGGDQVLFAKGGAWDASALYVFNTKARAGNRVTLADYTPPWASGDEKKPLLRNGGDGIFRFENGGNADHDEGYVVRNLKLQGSGLGKAIFFYNDVDDVLVENMEIDGFSIGVHLAGSNPPNPGSDSKNQRIELKNSRVTNCDGQGFLGGGDGLVIEGCYFENNGFGRAVYNHNIYVSGGAGVIIRGNELYKSAFINGKADGVSLVVHGVTTNLLLEGNYIHEDAGATTGNAWGIGVDTGYDSAEDFSGLIIRGNKLVNMYNVGIGVASCPGAIIENNVIINESASDVCAMAVPDRARGTNDLEMTAVTVRNNSIHLRNATSGARGISLSVEGTNHTVVGNIVSLDAGNCFSLNRPTNAYTAVDYNLGQLLGSATWCNGQSLSNWRTASGFDTHSLTGDPLFLAPGAPKRNLALSSYSSPAVNAGHPTLSATTDFTGAVRTGTPDIGALEYMLDADGDGMADAWEVANFGSTNAVESGAQEDWDHDGMNNFAEFVAGTSPTNAGSVFKVQGLEVQRETNFVIQWSSETGKWYAIRTATNLLAGFDGWAKTNIPATPAANTQTVIVDQVRTFFYGVMVE